MIIPVALALAAAATIADPFAYDRTKPHDVTIVNTITREGGVELKDITFASLTGARTPA